MGPQNCPHPRPCAAALKGTPRSPCSSSTGALRMCAFYCAPVTFQSASTRISSFFPKKKTLPLAKGNKLLRVLVPLRCVLITHLEV